jgi:hypothetical protein
LDAKGRDVVVLVQISGSGSKGTDASKIYLIREDKTPYILMSWPTSDSEPEITISSLSPTDIKA